MINNENKYIYRPKLLGNEARSKKRILRIVSECKTNFTGNSNRIIYSGFRFETEIRFIRL